MVKDLLKMRCPLCGGWIYENKLDKNIQEFTWKPKLQTAVWDKYKKQGKFVVIDCYDMSRITKFREMVKQRLLEILKVLFGFDVWKMLRHIPISVNGEADFKPYKLEAVGDWGL